MSIIEEYTPTHYRPTRISLEPDGAGGIVARADFEIRSITGRQITTAHPEATLTAGELSAFLAWFNDKCTTFETATGLERA